MVKNRYIFLFFILIISQSYATLPEIVLSDAGSYCFERVNNEIALVYIQPASSKQIVRVLPPTLFPLTAIIQSGSVTNQDIIQNLVTVAADNVIFNLNGFNLTQGLVISGRNVRVENGLIDPTAVSATASIASGINVLSGSADVVLDSITVRNATSGISLSRVSGGSISNCQMLFTSTGLLLNQSHNIVVENCIAEQCSQVGFSLISSTTNLFTDCTALSIGQGNTNVRNNSVFGFVSNNGYGNIFERCIANSTQALSTTDFNSVVAGFALRGTEGSSKIIECESANATTNPNGATVPYGILLQATLNSSITLTAVPPMPVPGDDVNSIAWSPDGIYLAVGFESADTYRVRVYEYDRALQTLTQVAVPNVVPSNGVNSLAWRPDGRYLLVGGQFSNPIAYDFNPTNNTLTQAGLVPGPGSEIFSLDWSPDGMFVATGDGGSTVKVFEFNAVAVSFTQVAAVVQASDVESVAWSPDGRYLATTDSTSPNIRVYRFSNNNLALISDASANPPGTSIIDWSPDGKYLASGSLTTPFIRIYTFNPNSSVLSLAATPLSVPSTGGVFIDWSADGNYLATDANGGTVYLFDRGSNQLSVAATTNIDPSGAIFRVRWSPDGGVIAVGDDAAPFVMLYQALSFPSQNVITNNIVYCNAGNRIPSGVGISGSSIANLIIQNTAYANPPSPFMVASNYVFAQNVFSQQFEQAPTELQNISLAYLVPIKVPVDEDLLAHQLQLKISGIESQLDILENMMDDPSISCISTMISTSTTITNSGMYCLANSITGTIKISGSNIMLNLNKHRVSQQISITSGSDQITILNGDVENTLGGTGISAQSSTNIEINNLRVRNSATAIDFSSINGALIKHCIVSDSLGGISMFACANVVIENTVAEKISEKGFSLISSTTCCVRDCKALGIGDGNFLQDTNSFNGIIGFDARGGYGNIFERCIANGTQGLTVTGGTSIVAGFRLGTADNIQEQATKIIECEASNATTSPNGVTIPYGILLEAQLSGLITVTAINPGNDTSSGFIWELAWSPDGNYLAVAGTLGDVQFHDLFIYKFNRLTKTLQQVTALNMSSTTGYEAVYAIGWSPDGNYLAVGGTVNGSGVPDLFIYRFDNVSETLRLIATINPGTVANDLIFAVAWSPDNNYLAVGGPIDTSALTLYLYRFNRVSETFEQVDAINPGGGGTDTLNSLGWSPDGAYLAAGGSFAGGGNEDLIVYKFDRASQKLFQVDAVNPGGGSTGDAVRAISWSFDGQYLAIGQGPGSPDLLSVFVYRFNRTTQKLTQVDGINPRGGTVDFVLTAGWSPDGQYLAVGLGFLTSAGNDLLLYKFDRGSEKLTQVDAINPTIGTSDNVIQIAWSPDGQYLAASTDGNTSENSVFIYQALTFPSNNVIKNNTVYCNSGAQFPSGIGISGSSISNMIIQNTAYANPILQTIYKPIVPTNYQFVTNVFNQQFQNMPTGVQNIEMGDLQAIALPQNEALLAKQFGAQTTVFGRCGPTTIVAPTSITQAGSYCVAIDIPGDISITTTSVVLDLNNRAVSGTISLANANDVLITNGFITPPVPTTTPSAALTVAATCNRVMLRGIIIDCSASSGDGIQGRDGIQIAANDIQVVNCTIKAGNASNRTTSGAGVRGGHGINLLADATRTSIQDCAIMQSGNGGAANTSGAGGDAGHGISVAAGATITKITNCLIMQTGVGGVGVSAIGGRGGDGVRVESGARDTQVRMCRMRNTGLGGSGSTLGVPGKAVFDLVTTPTSLSAVFNNFAHNIANPTKFDLQASSIAGGPDDGLLTPNPSTSAVINIFANVYSS